MLNKLKSASKRRSNKEGFTIVEVMIVLAIAGLILLIVFLAVPALQRTARNTQRKNDASAIGAAIANYDANNGNELPNTVAYAAGVVTLSCTVGGPNTGCTASANTETAKVGYYTAVPTLNITGSIVGISTSQVIIDAGFACNANNNGLGVATPRDAAVMYEIEPATVQCLEE